MGRKKKVVEDNNIIKENVNVEGNNDETTKKKKNKTKEGKQFEYRFKSFFERKNIFIQRVIDTAFGYKGSGSKADFIVFFKRNLYLFECKSHKGKSLPINCISDKQIKGMILESLKEDVYSYLIVNFRDVEETYAIDINKIFYLTKGMVIKRYKRKGEVKEKEVEDYIINTYLDRKSIPLEFIQENGTLITEKDKFSMDLINLL